MKIYRELQNRSTMKLLKEIQKDMYILLKIIFSTILSIVITYRLTMISSNIELFANSPILHGYVIIFTFSFVLYITLKLLKYIQNYFVNKHK